MDASRASVVILDPTLRRFGGFAVVPGCVLKDHLLASTAKVIYGMMLIYAWQDQEVKQEKGEKRRDVVQSLIADLGLSDSAVRRGLHELQHAKLISTVRLGCNVPNQYFVEPISKAYPDDVDWSKMTNPDLELSDLSNPEWSKMREIGSELSEMTIPNGEQNGEFVRDQSKMTNPNVKRLNVERSNVNVGNSQSEKLNETGEQLDISGAGSVLGRLVDEMARASGERYQNLHLTYRMVEELRDPGSLRFYWRVAQAMPAGVIEMQLSYVKDLELTGRLRKSKGAAFTAAILALAQAAGINLRTKRMKGDAR